MVLELLAGDLLGDLELLVFLELGDSLLSDLVDLLLVHLPTIPNSIPKFLKPINNILRYFQLQLRYILIPNILNRQLNKPLIHTFRQHRTRL